MSTVYNGNPANGARSPAVSPTLPSDGDAGNVASINAAIQELADHIAWLQAHGAVFDQSNTFSAAQTVAALLSLSTSDLQLTAAALQRILKAGSGRLQVGTASGNASDLELVRNGQVIAQVGLPFGGTDEGINLLGKVLGFVSKLLFTTLTADPMGPLDGSVWWRSDLHEIRARINSATKAVVLGPAGGLTSEWTTLSVNAPWATGTPAASALAYYKLMGRVFLRGYVTAGGSGGIIATLPVGVRPLQVRNLLCVDVNVGPPNSGVGFSIDNGGNITLNGAVSGHNYFFDGVSMAVEQ